MNLEKGSSLLIPEISRPIENDKKRSFEGVGGMGGLLIQNSRIMESEENATFESGSGLFLTLGFGTSGNLKPL